MPTNTAVVLATRTVWLPHGVAVTEGRRTSGHEPGKPNRYSDNGGTKERAGALAKTLLLGEHSAHVLVRFVQKGRLPLRLRFRSDRQDL